MLINSLIKSLWIAVRPEMRLEKGTTLWNKCSDKSRCTWQPLESSKVKQRAAKDLWIYPILPADSSVAFGKVHSLHSWGKLLRFLVICCRHLKPDPCSALSCYLLAYLPGTVKRLRIRLSAPMAAPALLTGNAGACLCRLFVPRFGREGGNPECALVAQPNVSLRSANAGPESQGRRLGRRIPWQRGWIFIFGWKEAKETVALLLNISPNPFVELEWFSHPCHHQQQQIPHNDAPFTKQLVN